MSLLTCGALTAQNKLALSLEIPDNAGLVKKIKLKSSYTGKKEIETELRRITISLQNEGYLLTVLDSIQFDSMQARALLHTGRIYKWASLKKGNIDDEALARCGYNEKLYARAPFSPKETARLMERILSWYENNGYPFARLKLDSIVIKEESIAAVLLVNKNKFIKIDSIVNEGNARIKKSFLTHYLHVKEGGAYNENDLKQVSQRLKQIPFLKEVKPQLVKITETESKLFLYLDKKNASQFDGILGLQPQPSGKTVLTGDVRIRLYNNIFRAGELFDLNWKRLQYQTQDFKTAITYPYLFKTPFGTDYSLSIYKRDTTFLDIQNNLGLQYLFKGLNYLKVFYRQKNTSLLSTAALASATVLPDYAHISTSSYGVGFFYENLDYKFNPRKGFSITTNASVGNRDIKKNPKLNDILYTNIQLRSTQYQADGNFAFYIPLVKYSTIKIGAQGGSVMGPQLFKNELYRIGGFKTLRGFDEQSIYASSYVISTLEYRFLFEQNSALIVFADGAWYENNSGGKYISDTPYSVGAGVSFETKAGIFQMNYALGSQFGNAFDFRTGKINFGLVNTF